MKKEYKPLYEKFGLNVVYYRKRKKLTQLQLAELVDIDRSHISAIELGNVGVSFDTQCIVMRYKPIVMMMVKIAVQVIRIGKYTWLKMGSSNSSMRCMFMI